MKPAPSERLIVALDFPSADDALRCVERIGEAVTFYKVGLELYAAAGPQIVSRLTSAGKSVFLDLKFHDIPNTVAGASARAVAMGADMFNVHALGGKAMMQAAAEASSRTAADLRRSPPVVLAVTVLTSLDSRTLEEEIGVALRGSLEEFVTEKARQAREAGLGGVVASPREVQNIRAACGEEFQIVTPGVRPTWAVADDQRRIATPSEAIAMGADRIVIGRPITRADNPPEAARRVLEEIT